MPTIHREDGFEFRIYTHDHRPPHVHARKAGGEVRIAIGAVGVRPVLMNIEGLSRAEARRALDIVEANQHAMLIEWRKIHGE